MQWLGSKMTVHNHRTQTTGWMHKSQQWDSAKPHMLQSCMCRGLEQEKQDLGRQVQTLLIQLQGGEGAEPVLRLTQGGETGLVTSDDVITDRLLSFTDVQVPAGQCAGAWL